METTDSGAQPTDAVIDADSPRPVVLRAEVFDLACANRRAFSKGAKARLIGVDRNTLDRWYAQPVAVPLDLAMHVAQILDRSIEQLWQQVEATS